jgi:Xaa-Pro aminopeptidase
VFHLENKFNGKPTARKYEQVAEALNKEATSLLVTTLDDICWLLNLRGNDIEYNPVFFSYLIFYPKELKSTLLH